MADLGMGIDTEKYIRKPLYVDAVRVTAQNFDEVVNWCQGTVESEGTKKFIRVRVAFAKDSRQTKAFVGDWVLWTQHGGYKVYLNNAFKKAFDLVTNDVVGVPDRQGDVVTPPTPIESGGPQLTSDTHTDADLVVDTPIESGEGQPQVQDTPTSPPPVTETGKRVLTIAEQREMGTDEVRELLRSGEVVLAQDLVA